MPDVRPAVSRVLRLVVQDATRAKASGGRPPLPVQMSDLIDLGAKGFSVGDQIEFADDVFTEKGGTMIGTDGGSCAVVRVTDATAGSGTLQCVVTFSFDDGDVTAQGLFTFTEGHLTGTQTAATTGGTGRFREAAGEVAVEFLSDTEANVTLTFDD